MRTAWRQLLGKSEKRGCRNACVVTKVRASLRSYGQLGAGHQHLIDNPLVLLSFRAVPCSGGLDAPSGPAQETEALNQPPFRRMRFDGRRTASGTECGMPRQRMLRRRSLPQPCVSEMQAGSTRQPASRLFAAEASQFPVYSCRRFCRCCFPLTAKAPLRRARGIVASGCSRNGLSVTMAARLSAQQVAAGCENCW